MLYVQGCFFAPVLKFFSQSDPSSPTSATNEAIQPRTAAIHLIFSLCLSLLVKITRLMRGNSAMFKLACLAPTMSLKSLRSLLTHSDACCELQQLKVNLLPLCNTGVHNKHSSSLNNLVSSVMSQHRKLKRYYKHVVGKMS